MLAPAPTFEGMNCTICTTYDCNLRCRYCYENNKRRAEIPIETAYKFIDKILEDPDPIGATGTADEWIPKSGLVLDFIGGDSFMNPDIMDKVLTYFQYKATSMNHPYAKHWRASISSNGTLFGDPAVQQLIEKWGENLSIGISVDGCPAIHDAYRIFRDKGPNGEEVGTMKTIMDWWFWVKERQPSAVNHTKATCSKASIPYLYDSMRFMHECLGVPFINQNFIMEDTGCEESDYVILDEMYRKCSDYVVAHRHEMYWSMFDKQGLVRRSDNYADHKSSLSKGWCGSGAMPTVGMDGNIYPCFRWLPHTMVDAEAQATTMCVGNVNEGFIHKDNFRQVKEASRGKISSKYCLQCEYEGGCAYCIGGCYSEFHDFKRTEHICQIAKLRMSYSRRYWDIIEELEHGHYDYFKDSVNGIYERKDDVDITVKRADERYGADGKLKPGIEPTEEEIKFKENVDYWMRKAARDTKVWEEARKQNDVVLNTLKTAGTVEKDEETLAYQVHGN